MGLLLMIKKRKKLGSFWKKNIKRHKRGRRSENSCKKNNKRRWRISRDKKKIGKMKKEEKDWKS